MAREHKWFPNGFPQAISIDERALGAARDKIVRDNSVRNDIYLDLPVSIQRLEEEERTRRSSPQQLPSGYDSRSEIQRQYIKPPPNKTVYCIPDDTSKGSCSCGPTISQSYIQKQSSSAGNSSGWGLNWSRGNKSPPTSHNHRQQQRHIHSSNPSTCRTSSEAKSQKSVLGPSASVIGTFLAGVITSASGSGVQYKDNLSSVKSITQQGESCDSDLAKLRCLSERKPVNNNRTSPTPNLNSSVCRGTLRQGDDSVLMGNYSQNFKYNELGSSPHQSANTRDLGSSMSNPFCLESCTYSNSSDNAINRSKKFDRKKDKKNGNKTPALSVVDAEEVYVSEPKTCGFSQPNYNCLGELVDGNSPLNVPSMTDPQLYHSAQPCSSASLNESIQETGHCELSESATTTNQLTDKYCTTIAEATISSSEIIHSTPKQPRWNRRGDAT